MPSVTKWERTCASILAHKPTTKHTRIALSPTTAPAVVFFIPFSQNIPHPLDKSSSAPYDIREYERHLPKNFVFFCKNGRKKAGNGVI